ncbi:MAG TPA: hypothetical protein VFE57_01535 [Cyclobacteriaceae bacterium]|jgi:hypothetical protein|nr:hypothetical protein [Cyclobacteriaceae bacterium]
MEKQIFEFKITGIDEIEGASLSDALSNLSVSEQIEIQKRINAAQKAKEKKEPPEIKQFQELVKSFLESRKELGELERQYEEVTGLLEISRQEDLNNNVDESNSPIGYDNLDQINKDMVDLLGRGVVEESVRATQAAMNESEETKEQLNQFGLPVNWAYEKSAEALGQLRKILTENNYQGKEISKEVFGRIIATTSEDYQKYKNKKIPAFEVRGESVWELDHLKMNPEEKLAWFKHAYPNGLTIMRSGKSMRWENILDYELWAMRNHDQTFASLQRRGGLSPKEIVSILFGISDFDELKDYRDEDIVKWFEDNGMLQEAAEAAKEIHMENKEDTMKKLSRQELEKEIEENIKRLLDTEKMRKKKTEIEGFKLLSNEKGFKLETTIKVNKTGIPFNQEVSIDLKVSLENNRDGVLDIGTYSINAGKGIIASFAEKELEPLMPQVVPGIKTYFEQKYNKHIESMKIENGELVLQFQGENS